ncbi:hypothetical protein DMA11_05940 [Marinilabiliaceae bacterium JC017]|nr:hypothetical protein DMA11_05940 [Marinilabiliaceae bacterium JC017]
MRIINRLEKIKHLDQLIRMRKTGALGELAQRVGLSERQTRRYLEEMKDMGADISYNKQMHTYEYVTPVKFSYGFTRTEMEKVFGGMWRSGQKMAGCSGNFDFRNKSYGCYPG